MQELAASVWVPGLADGLRAHGAHTSAIEMLQCFTGTWRGDGPRVTGPPAIHAHSSRGFS